jgi:hypothetical protein
MTASTIPSAPSPAAADSPVGRTELGMIRIDDRVVEKMAAQAAVEIPDAGGAAPRVLGHAMTGRSLRGPSDQPDCATKSYGRCRRLARGTGSVHQHPLASIGT